MTTLERAFVAVYPPRHVVDALDARLGVARRSSPDVRWSPPAQWHVTLRFLGRVPDPARLTRALDDVGRGWAPFEIRLASAGAFPTAGRGSVLWVGIDDPGGDLHRLAGAVDGACGATGAGPEARLVHAHLTVARASRPRDLRPLLAAIDEMDEIDGTDGALTWLVDEVRLVASDTRPSGAVHSEVARVALVGSGG